MGPLSSKLAAAADIDRLLHGQNLKSNAHLARVQWCNYQPLAIGSADNAGYQPLAIGSPDNAGDPGAQNGKRDPK